MASLLIALVSLLDRAHELTRSLDRALELVASCCLLLGRLLLWQLELPRKLLRPPLLRVALVVLYGHPISGALASMYDFSTPCQR
ncbi:hypothetical protein ACFPRL_14130 [Pseudoclavibacter helvolus]